GELSRDNCSHSTRRRRRRRRRRLLGTDCAALSSQACPRGGGLATARIRSRASQLRKPQTQGPPLVLHCRESPHHHRNHHAPRTTYHHHVPLTSDHTRTRRPIMAQQPSTPVKVPSSAANYTPATLDPDLRSQINTVLLRDGHVAKIQEALLHALNSHPSNWPTAVQAHALTLLRDGEVSTYPALLRRVLDDVRASSPSSPATFRNGSKTPNGDASRIVNGTAAAAAAGGGGLALPEVVIEEALRVARESLEAVCEIEDAGS
ncbi:Uncharacterized protein TCAP_06280, partial [Tolypocladium capitatum]